MSSACTLLGISHDAAKAQGKLSHALTPFPRETKEPGRWGNTQRSWSIQLPARKKMQLDFARLWQRTRFINGDV